MTLKAPFPIQKTLRHRTVSAAVADDLRRRIVDGEFASGFQLRQDALAAEFGVSRIPVREALRQLEAEGVVDVQPNRGAFVRFADYRGRGRFHPYVNRLMVAADTGPVLGVAAAPLPD